MLDHSLPPIKMTNQRTKLDQATPVRTMATVHFPGEIIGRHPHIVVASARDPRDAPRQTKAVPFTLDLLQALIRCLICLGRKPINLCTLA